MGRKFKIIVEVTEDAENFADMVNIDLVVAVHDTIEMSFNSNLTEGKVYASSIQVEEVFENE